VDSVFSLAKSRLPTALEAKFAEFAVALVDTHGKDLTVSGDPSRSGTPAPAASTSGGGASAAAPPAPKPAEKKSSINTTKITVEGSFMAAADDLFGLLTDEKRIPMWTRASAQVAPALFFEFLGFLKQRFPVCCQGRYGLRSLRWRREGQICFSHPAF
jgi:activator of HSP90 ATPase